MITPRKAVLAIHPVLGGFWLNPLAGGKDVAAAECTNVLCDLGCDVLVLPLEWGNYEPSEKILSRHTIFWENRRTVDILPTCRIPSLKELARYIITIVFKKLRRTGEGSRAELYHLVCSLPKSTALALEENPILVHVHQTNSPAVLEIKKLRRDIPVLLTNHSGVLSDYATNYDHVVFPSRWMRSEAIQRIPDLEKRSSVISYFIQDDYWSVLPDERLGEYIIFIGLLENHRKGLDILIDALAILRRQGVCFPLKVIGEGRCLEGYRAAAKAAGIEVDFLGKLTNAENAAYLRSARLFCMPSREENFPLVYIEAIASGIPCIGYPQAIVELNELLECEVGGAFDANNESADQLAKFIVAWMDRKCAEFMTRKGMVLKKARSLFSRDAYDKAYTRLYKDMAPMIARQEKII